MARPRKNAAPVRTKTRFCNGLIFGPPGHGKSRFLGTAVFDERTCPIAILDFEGGVRDVLEGLPGEDKDWFHLPISSWHDYNEAYERCRSNDEGFRSVAIDSISETHIWILMNIVDTAINREDRDLIQQGDYGKGLVQLRRLVREFRDLPMHAFFTSHDKTETSPKEGLIQLPNLSGKAATEIPGLMTFSGYLALGNDDEGETQRILLLNNYAKIRTKIRTPWGVTPPDEIEDPTVTAVLDALGY